jgi:PEP-CTERM motif/WD40-like Beta Propeller Repeat
VPIPVVRASRRCRGACLLALAIGVACAVVGGTAQAGSGLKLNQTPLPGEYIERFGVLPNGEGVVYSSGGFFSDEPADIFVAPIAGGPSTLLSGSLARTYGSRGFRIPPNGDSVLLWININLEHNRQDLYRVPTTGGVPVPLIEREVPGESRLDTLAVEGFNADGTEMIYRADYDGPDEFYAIPILGGAPQKISAPLGPGEGLVSASNNFNFSPDRAHMVYGVNNSSIIYAEKLVSVPTGGGSFATLNDGVGPAVYLTGQVLFTPDGSQVVFKTGQGVYVNSVLGGTPTLLNRPSGTSSVDETAVSPDGNFVAYQSSEGGSFEDVYSVPISGGEPVLLFDATQSSFGNRIWGFSPDSARVIFQYTDSLYSVPTSGTSPPTMLSEAPVVSTARIVDSPVGARALYRHSGGSNDLYSVNLDGTDRVMLNMPLDPDVMRIDDRSLTTPDGRFVLFGVDSQPRFRDVSWFAVPIDGGNPVQITPTLPDGAWITEVELTPDGSKLVYHAGPNGLSDLFVAGLPLAAVDSGAGVAGDVLGGVGFGGGIGFEFDNVAAEGILTAEFFREAIGDLDPDLASSIDFVLPGDTMHLWDLSFDGVFSDGVSLTFTYDEALLGAGVAESNLAIYHQLDGGGWEELTTLARDLEANTITVQVGSFSNFSVGVVPEPSSIILLALGTVGWILLWRSQRRC